MKLWIRSQNKNYLVEAQNIEYSKQYQSHNIVVNDCHFGTYKSEERCLEIINEIQKLLGPYASIEIPYSTDRLSIQDLSTYVYNMPKE